MVAYSFKKQFIEPIKAGLRLGKNRGAKRQTVRAIGKRRHARVGEIVQLYYGMRTKQCAQIGVGKCVSSEPIELDLEKGRVLIRTDDGAIIHDTSRGMGMLDMFARADGFSDWADLVAFWRKEHPGIDQFHGQLIKWEPIR